MPLFFLSCTTNMCYNEIEVGSVALLEKRKFMFESSLEKLARILARSYGIDVIFEGNKAYTDGKKIVLPFFKDLSEELKADLNGFLDHEVAHCKFSNMGLLGKGSMKRKIVHTLFNGAEDIRIERLMKVEFPGCGFNLDPLRAKVDKHHREIWKDIAPLMKIAINIQWAMRSKALMVDPDLKRYWDAIESDVAQLNSCKTSDDLLPVIESIVKKLEDERMEEKEEQKENDEDKKKEKNKDKKKGDNKDSQKSKSKDKGEESDEEEDGSSEGSGDDEESDEGEESDSESGDEESDGESSDGEGDSDGEGSEGLSDDDGKEMDEMMAEATSSSKTSTGEPSGFDSAHLDIESFVNEEIKDKIEEEKPKQKRTSGYTHDTSKTGMRTSIPVTTRFDKVTDHTGKGNDRTYQLLRKKVRPMVAPIKAHLERVLKVKENARWQTEREQGKVNGRALSKLASDPGYRQVFKEFRKTETNNVAVEILVDMSGSMDWKMDTAKMAAIAMCEALKELDIKFEVTGFRSEACREVSDVASRLSPDERGRFNRTAERLSLHVFKDFNSPSLNGIEKLFGQGNNPDGECVKWAANRLALRREKRKILIVLSDGQPAAHADIRVLQAHLKDTVKEIEKSGIECVGIGVTDDAVKHYYDNYAVINDISKLPTETMAKLAKIIGA